jgi:hypothetical protein
VNNFYFAHWAISTAGKKDGFYLKELIFILA